MKGVLRFIRAVPGINLTEEEKEAVETRGGRGGKAEQQVVLTAMGRRGIKTAVAAMEDDAAAAMSKLIFAGWNLAARTLLILSFAASFAVF